MGQQGKPPTLAEMKTLAHHINSHHWECLPKNSALEKTNLTTMITNLITRATNPTTRKIRLLAATVKAAEIRSMGKSGSGAELH